MWLVETNTGANSACLSDGAGGHKCATTFNGPWAWGPPSTGPAGGSRAPSSAPSSVRAAGSFPNPRCTLDHLNRGRRTCDCVVAPRAKGGGARSVLLLPRPLIWSNPVPARIQTLLYCSWLGPMPGAFNNMGWHRDAGGTIGQEIGLTGVRDLDHQITAFVLLESPPGGARRFGSLAGASTSSPMRCPPCSMAPTSTIRGTLGSVA